jgi:tetratricopeptide (TPR) repeat protein
MGICLASGLLLIGAWPAFSASRFDAALELERKGNFREARLVLRAAVVEFRAAGDQPDLARALTAAGKVSVSLGDYRAAIQEASEAIQVRRELKDEVNIGEDYNTAGLAHQYLGDYSAALDNYKEALRIGLAHADSEGVIIRLNNIGNVAYFLGRYSDSLLSYQDALQRVNATAAEPWNPRRRQLTLANLATLYQRLGREQSALGLYQQLARGPAALPPDERAQLLLNQGVLYRRMGDPVRALELYRDSQVLFATVKHTDGEIGALRNIGIARALDMADLPGALDAFTAALQLARTSANARGVVQANLYLGEARRRMHRLPEAARDCRAALEGAQAAGLVEEQSKSLYALGRIAEEEEQPERAAEHYIAAIAIIESVRSGVRQASLRSEFLADRSDAYDALIALRLRQSPPPLEDLLKWIERGRARTLRDSLAPGGTTADVSIHAIQSRLPADTVLVNYWVGSASSAALWITASDAGVVRHALPAETLRESISQLDSLIQAGGGEWTGLARSLGREVLMAVPIRSYVIVVPDGPLSMLPFEVLGVPGSEDLLIEESAVIYAPSAQIAAHPNRPRGRWLFPWHTQLVAYGDPPVSPVDTLAEAEQWRALPASAQEVRAIAGLLPGRAELHLGADARKRYLLDRRIEGVSLLHLSSHAVVDAENPDRSRILLAADSPGRAFDYLFLEEVYHLDLKGVDLVTAPACDMARGKLVRGEGVEAFSRAFLAAGASATITSLWRVADQPTADFMKQFYYFLSRGDSKADALRAAKLRFLHSGSNLAGPRYWAAFVLNGDRGKPSARAIRWSTLLGLPAVGLCLALCLRSGNQRRKWQRRARRIVARKPEYLDRLGR